MEWVYADFTLTDETTAVHLDEVCNLLSKTYWASTRSTDVVARSLQGSLNFSLFYRGLQVGLTRVITDRVTYAYLCDVVIAEDFRRQGIGQWMLSRILEHPEIQVNRVALITLDAHGFYEKFGFKTGEAMFRVKTSKEAISDENAV